MAAMRIMTGNMAAAAAAELAAAQVVSVHPTAQQEELAVELARAGRRKKDEVNFFEANSQHEAMAYVIGAAQAGARTFTAASSQSLASCHELLFWTAYSRLPVVMANASGALGPGVNLWSDTTDAAAQRDCGWIQLFCETNQEVLDSTLIAFRLAEEVALPVMVSYDSFVLSHTLEAVDVPDREQALSFIGAGPTERALDVDDPRALGPYTTSEHYMEFRRALQEAHEETKRAFEGIAKDFSGAFGRSYCAVEPIFTKGSDTALVACGSMVGTARAAAERMHRDGELAGLVKMRMLRPFPAEALRDAVCARGGAMARIAVLDRNAGHGAGGVWAQEVRAALAGVTGAPRVIGVHAGLGGRDVSAEEMVEIYSKVKGANAGVRTIWWGTTG